MDFFIIDIVATILACKKNSLLYYQLLFNAGIINLSAKFVAAKVKKI